MWKDFCLSIGKFAPNFNIIEIPENSKVNDCYYKIGFISKINLKIIDRRERILM